MYLWVITYCDDDMGYTYGVFSTQELAQPICTRLNADYGKNPPFYVTRHILDNDRRNED